MWSAPFMTNTSHLIKSKPCNHNLLLEFSRRLLLCVRFLAPSPLLHFKYSTFVVVCQGVSFNFVKKFFRGSLSLRTALSAPWQFKYSIGVVPCQDFFKLFSSFFWVLTWRGTVPLLHYQYSTCGRWCQGFWEKNKKEKIMQKNLDKLRVAGYNKKPAVWSAHGRPESQVFFENFYDPPGHVCSTDNGSRWVILHAWKKPVTFLAGLFLGAVLCQFHCIVRTFVSETDFCFIFESQIFNFAVKVETIKHNFEPTKDSFLVLVNLSFTLAFTLFSRLAVGFRKTSDKFFLFISQSEQFFVTAVNFIITLNEFNGFLSRAFERCHVFLNQSLKLFFRASSHSLHLSFCIKYSRWERGCQPLSAIFSRFLWSRRYLSLHF